jgi:hypothetical protein
MGAIMSDLADWVAAIGTTGATFLAAAAITVQQRDRRRAAADSIGAWIETKDEGGLLMATIHVLNTGNQPVFEVAARAVGQNNFTRDYWALRDVPPGEQAARGQNEWGDHMDAIDFPHIELYFRDVSGRGWHRGPGGRLRRVYRPKSAYHYWMKWVDEAEWEPVDVAALVNHENGN